jgi:hypothetical protein
MKRQISRLHRFEEISRRYNGPIPKHEYTRLESITPASIDKDKAVADLRFWKNYIKSGIAAYRTAATPKRREQIGKDVQTAWPKYRRAFRTKFSVKSEP